MTEKQKTDFLATYFNRDSILRLARLADIFAWIALAYYAAQAGIAIVVYALQSMRGIIIPGGFTDVFQQLIWMLQPLVSPGLLYFIGIQAIGKALLILMDIEDNLRRAARNKS